MRAEVEPQITTRLGANAAPNAVGTLEHHDVAIAQIPRGAEPGDAGADHDDIVLLRLHVESLAPRYGRSAAAIAETPAGVTPQHPPINVAPAAAQERTVSAGKPPAPPTAHSRAMPSQTRPSFG